jgi:hypothetical protein
MATFEITIDEEKIRDLLHGDRGIAVLVEPVQSVPKQAPLRIPVSALPRGTFPSFPA